MPAADDLVHFDFDDGFEQQQSTPPSNTPPTTSKKKKKSKKNALAAAKAKLEEEEETPYPKSVTPSPPTGPGVGDGVRLGVDVTELEAVTQVRETQSPPAEDFEHQDMAWEEGSPPTLDVTEPAPEVQVPQPPASPVVRSPPRPQAARPAGSPALYPRVPLPNSPPRRMSTLYGSPGTYNNAYQPVQPVQEEPPQPQAQVRPRRESHTKARGVDPPLPHMPQAHFNHSQLPDYRGHVPQPQPQMQPIQNLQRFPNTQANAHVGGKSTGQDSYTCTVLDSFSECGNSASAKKAKDALLVGSNGGLDVYRVLGDRMEVLGRLEGLRGRVVGARVIPGVCGETVGTNRPWVALLIHGRVAGQDGIEELWQTSVEMYSLQEQRHLATLLKTTPVSGYESPHVEQHPAGDLEVSVAGAFITISSGVSGEIFIFTHTPPSDPNGTEAGFRCISKLWTSIQSRPSSPASRPGSSADVSAAPLPPKPRGIPLLSLSSRWLAICPPSTTSAISIGGSPLLHDSTPAPFGAATHTPPPPPLLNCDVVGVGAEGTWNKLGRQAAQGLMIGAQKGYTLGLGAWKELTQPSSPPPAYVANGHVRDRPGDAFPPTHAGREDPRRKNDEPAVVSIVDLARLLEASETGLKHPPPPLATFALPEGCNHLSFSPNGLRLLTSSRKGEVSSIWDLRHLAHTSLLLFPARELRHQNGFDAVRSDEMKVIGPWDPPTAPPSVRLEQRIVRSSPSVLVDVCWDLQGRRVGLLTANGTVHLHEIGLGSGGRKRRRGAAGSVVRAGTGGLGGGGKAEKAGPTVGMSSGLSPPSSGAGGLLIGLKGAWSSWATAKPTDPQPKAAASTEKSPAQQAGNHAGWQQNLNFAGFKSAASVAGRQGGRVVSQTLRQGMEAARSGVEEAWRAEENKIRVRELQPLPDDAAANGTGAGTGNTSTANNANRARKGLMRWISLGAGTSCLAIAAAGTVALHPVETVVRARNAEPLTTLRQQKSGSKNFALPVHTAAAHAMRDAGCGSQGPHGFWLPVPAAPKHPARGGNGVGAGFGTGVGATEVDTNPPYCPFHIDARLGVFAFADLDDGGGAEGMDGGSEAEAVGDSHGALLGHGVSDGAVWLFGEAMPDGVQMNEGVGPGAGAEEEDGLEGFGQGIEDADLDYLGLDDGIGGGGGGGGLVGDGEGDADEEAAEARSVRSVMTVSRVSPAGGSGGGEEISGGARGFAATAAAAGEEEEEIRVHTSHSWRPPARSAKGVGGRRRKSIRDL